MAELGIPEDDSGARAAVERSVDERGVPVVCIVGEIDMSNVEAVEAQFASAFADRPARVVFDLSALTFIDSSGLASLLRAADRTDRLELRNPSTIVARVLEATGLSEILPVVP